MNSKKPFVPVLSFFAGAMILFALIPSVAGCSGKGQKLQTRELTIQRSDGSQVRVTAEIASTEEERAQGLMFRKELAGGEGMLFVFDRDQLMNFWMKNTLIPLSIAYISSEGRILEIHSMKPHSESPVRSSRSARYALEVPEGWFASVNVKPGDILIGYPVKE